MRRHAADVAAPAVPATRGDESEPPPAAPEARDIQEKAQPLHKQGEDDRDSRPRSILANIKTGRTPGALWSGGARDMMISTIRRLNCTPIPLPNR